MKVLHVISGLGVGGAELFLARLISATQDSASHIVVALTKEGQVSELLRARNVDVRHLDGNGRSGPLALIGQLIRIIREVSPDLVQTWLYHGDLLGGVAGRCMGLPVCWNVRQSRLDTRYTKLSTYAVALACAVVSRLLPTAIITCADAAVKSHVRLGFPRHKFHVIPNGVDTRVFVPSADLRAEVRKELDLANEDILVGVVGRLDPQKNHETVFRVAEQIMSENPRVSFAYAGAGLTRANMTLPETVRGADQRTKLLGLQANMQRLATAFDIILSGSLDEGFPNAIAEAMSTGSYPVVTDVGDSKQLVGDTGIVALAPTYGEIFHALSSAVNMEPSRIRALGQLARERVEKMFSQDHAAESYLAIWRSLSLAAR